EQRVPRERTLLRHAGGCPQAIARSIKKGGWPQEIRQYMLFECRCEKALVKKESGGWKIFQNSRSSSRSSIHFRWNEQQKKHRSNFFSIDRRNANQYTICNVIYRCDFSECVFWEPFKSSHFCGWAKTPIWNFFIQ